MSPRCPRLVVWQGAAPDSASRLEQRMGFMLKPVVSTLLSGLWQTSSEFSAEVIYGGGPGERLQHMTASLVKSDLFIWVGLWRLVTDGESVLRNLTERGVHTVFYSTDAADMAAAAPGWACRLNSRLMVSEVWEYSHSTIDFCRRYGGGLRHVTRYVPPGFVLDDNSSDGGHVDSGDGGGGDAGGDGSGAGGDGGQRRRHELPRQPQRQQLVMLGALTYPPRVGCFQALSASLASTVGRSGDSGSLLVSFNDVWSDAAMGGCLRRGYRHFVNLHKDCGASRDCETLRFAQLLNAGAHSILSDRCHPEDEKEWQGLVTFANRSHLATAFLLRSGSASLSFSASAHVTAADISAEEALAVRRRRLLFSQRLSPARIFRRAQIDALISRLATAAAYSSSSLACAPRHRALQSQRSPLIAPSPMLDEGCRSDAFEYRASHRLMQKKQSPQSQSPQSPQSQAQQQQQQQQRSERTERAHHDSPSSDQAWPNKQRARPQQPPTSSTPEMPSQHVDCAVAVPHPLDASPIRSPQAVHSALAARIRGKDVAEIGTRNGDGMQCFARVVRSAVAIELDAKYCAALRARAASLAEELNGTTYTVACEPYQSSDRLDADIVTWWEEGPHLFNAQVLAQLRRAQVSSSCCRNRQGPLPLQVR